MIEIVEPQPSESFERPIEPVRIARMRPSDIEAVTRLEVVCQALPWSSNAYATELNNPVAYYDVAKTLDGELAGYGGIWVVVDELHVTNIVSNPKFRGRRVGERLLLHLLQEGVRRGAKRATLEVREGNRIAHNLYLKYRFKDVAMRKKYYSDNRENAIIMWAEDLTGPEFQSLLREREAALRCP